MADNVPLPVLISMALVDFSKFIIRDFSEAIYPCTVKQPVITIASTAIFCGVCSFAFPKASPTTKCFTFIALPTMTACLTVAIIARKRFQFYKALNSDKKALLTALQKNGLMLQYGGEFKKDDTVVLAAVGQNGLALRYADATMQSNKKVVSVAVVQNGLALRYAGATMQGNKEIVKQAFSNNASSLKHADSILRNNKNFILELAKLNKQALHYADKDLWNDDEYLLGAINIDPEQLIDNSNFWRRISDQSDKVILALLKKKPCWMHQTLFRPHLSRLDFVQGFIIDNNEFVDLDWSFCLSKEDHKKLLNWLEANSKFSVKSAMSNDQKN